MPSVLESGFAMYLKATKFPPPVQEYIFHPERKWRFDFAWVDKKIAVELEGGVWSGGRHTRGKGYIEDLNKYNQAVLLGWRVLRFTNENMYEGVKLLERLFKL